MGLPWVPGVGEHGQGAGLGTAGSGEGGRGFPRRRLFSPATVRVRPLQTWVPRLRVHVPVSSRVPSPVSQQLPFVSCCLTISASDLCPVQPSVPGMTETANQSLCPAHSCLCLGHSVSQAPFTFSFFSFLFILLFLPFPFSSLPPFLFPLSYQPLN